VAVAADGSRAAGAGLLALSRGVRSSPCSRGHLSLGFNEPSSPDFSGTSTEANGLIGSPPGGFDGWVPAILQHLATVPGWDELRINALSDADAGCFVQAAADLGLLAHVFGERQTYWVDLDGLRERHGGDYLASRSVNTRQQLRSAIKRLRVEQGGFSLTRAATRAQGHEWLDALSVLHRQRWNAHGETGGFANPAFARYHHALVEQMLDSGGVEVLRAAAGDQTVAYLYNFVVDGRVYFDMSGVDHGRYARYRPGLLAHWQAIEWYQQRGMRIYDFQAGTNRYKQSLATHSANRIDLILRRPWFKFKVEAAARWLKRQMAHDEPPAGSRRTD
jgi:hypothetical protein